MQAVIDWLRLRDASGAPVGVTWLDRVLFLVGVAGYLAAEPNWLKIATALVAVAFAARILTDVIRDGTASRDAPPE